MKKALVLSAAIATALAPFGGTQDPPAPTVDRVGFPAGHQDWPILYVYDRPDNRSVRTTFANPIAFAVKDGEQSNYPYGSILVSWYGRLR